MEFLIYRKPLYCKTSDKYNDNVICYAVSEVVLCH